jgi:hypothetical protein
VRSHRAALLERRVNSSSFPLSSVEKQNGEPEGPPRRSSDLVYVLRRFVANGGSYFVSELRWNFGHVVGRARVFGALLQYVLDCLTARYEIAVNADVLQSHQTSIRTL